MHTRRFIALPLAVLASLAFAASVLAGGWATVTINDPQVYEKPWEARTRLPLKRLPDNADFLEQIYAASEVTEFKEDVASKTKTQ